MRVLCNPGVGPGPLVCFVDKAADNIALPQLPQYMLLWPNIGAELQSRDKLPEAFVVLGFAFYLQVMSHSYVHNAMLGVLGKASLSSIMLVICSYKTFAPSAACSCLSVFHPALGYSELYD